MHQHKFNNLESLLTSVNKLDILLDKRDKNVF